MKKIILTIGALFLVVQFFGQTYGLTQKMVLDKAKENGTDGRILDIDKKVKFKLYGEGGLRENVTKKAENSNVANGSIGAGFITKKMAVGIAFTIADPSETDATDSTFFGPSLMSPSLKSTSFSLTFDHFLDADNQIALRGFLLGANDSLNFGDITKEVSLMSYGVYLSFIPYNFEIDSLNSVSLSFDLM